MHDISGSLRARMRRMKLLTFTTLYPNESQPVHGIFIDERLRHMVDAGGIDATVVAPVPWFPSAAHAFGRYAHFARVPREESRRGIRVLHPRYPLIPKLGMRLAPWLMASAASRTVRALLAEPGGFDLIEGHYLYPDGVAAAALARRFSLPLVLSARGSDVNLIGQYVAPRRWMVQAVRQSAATITVSQALRDRLCDMGAPAERIIVIRNGVDLERFKPLARAPARATLGYDGFSALVVGTLIENKGQQFAIEALKHVPDMRLTLIGNGAARARFEDLARRLGVSDRLRFLGTVPHELMPGHYSAADALILASEREGMPNAVLEALACGLPVIATPVGGVPELVTDPEAGRLMRQRDVAELVRCIGELRANPPDRDRIRSGALKFDWASVARRQIEVYAGVLDERRRRVGPSKGATC
jgi:glycosyltransferase involved in cell wall biosynthesis